MTHRALSVVPIGLVLGMLFLGCQSAAPASSAPGAPDALDHLLAAHSLQSLADQQPAKVAAGADGSLFFMVAGHLYGAPDGDEPSQPASSLTSQIDDLRDRRPDFFMALGDIVRVPDEPHVSNLRRVLARLDRPVMNAPGNHDVQWSHHYYRSLFGPSFGGFRVGDSLFLVLDTELDPWNITGEQLTFLRSALAAAESSQIGRLFLFAHRTLFGANDARYRVVGRKCNSRAGWPGSTNFQTEVVPLLSAFAETRDVTWFSGDVGIARSYGLFQDYDERTGIRYIAVGLGDMPWDNVVTVRLDARGDTHFDRIALNDQDMPTFEKCSLDAWNARFPESDRDQ